MAEKSENDKAAKNGVEELNYDYAESGVDDRGGGFQVASKGRVGAKAQEKRKEDWLSAAAPDRVVFIVLFVLLESGFKRVSVNVQVDAHRRPCHQQRINKVQDSEQNQQGRH